MTGPSDTKPPLKTVLRSALLHGDFEGTAFSQEVSERLGTPAGHVAALGSLLARHWLGDPIDPSIITRIEELAINAPEICSDLAMICAAGERVSVLDFNSSSLERWLTVHGKLNNGDPEILVRHREGSAWLELMKGNIDAATRRFKAVTRDARKLGLADCLVVTECGIALSALDTGEVGDAVTAARRASRMARTESLPHQELLAHLVLARVRRTAGMPYLATRILTALSTLAPPFMRSWIVWEQLLAGSKPSFSAPATSPAGYAARALWRVLDCAASGRNLEFQRALSEGLTWASGFHGLAQELADLALCLDVNRSTEEGSPATTKWLIGCSDVTPRGFHGIVQHGTADVDTKADMMPTVGFLFSSPDVASRRVLGPGAQLSLQGDTVWIDKCHSPQRRTLTALVVLTQHSGQWLDEQEFFRSLYGFSCDPRRHNKVLDNLILRARKQLGSGGTLHRHDGRLRLEASKPLLLWDPRCERPLEDWILAALSRGASKTARETAAEVGVSLRTVQAVLKDLTETHACVPQRSGRNIAYTVEDTSFSELTRSRFQRHLARAKMEQ